jgi:hypothetical protein
MLREQAAVLRQLASSFEKSDVRGDLFILAKRCEELADEVGRDAPTEFSRRVGALVS